MGSIIRAKCPCGLSQKVLFGGGLGSHLVFCAFPCYCQDCHWLFEGNLFDERVRFTMCDSERYLPYDDERLRIVELHPEPPPPEYKKQTLWERLTKRELELIERYWVQENAIASWNTKDRLGRVLVLTDEKYLCPHCQEFQLTFEQAGCFD